jgi:hypothetical protein
MSCISYPESKLDNVTLDRFHDSFGFGVSLAYFIDSLNVSIHGVHTDKLGSAIIL